MKYTFNIELHSKNMSQNSEKVVKKRQYIKKLNPEKQIQKELRNSKNNNKGIINNLKILQEFETINKEPFKANAYEKVIDAIEMYE